MVACPTCLLRYGQEYCLTKSDLNPAAETQLDTPTWLIAVRAAESKKATDIKVLDLTGITSFADYFVICTGSQLQRQIQAISDEVGPAVEAPGAANCPTAWKATTRPNGCWPITAICWCTSSHPKSREYYGLERLWRSAKTVEIPAE